MILIKNPTILQRINPTNSVIPLHAAKNLNDLIKTISQHEISTKDELINIIFQTPIKISRLDHLKYELPYFYNDEIDHELAEDFADQYIQNGCSLIQIIDESIPKAISVYGHKDITEHFNKHGNGEVNLLKPMLTFESFLGVGFGILNDGGLE
jgi:hypothetical protein